jgi:hypothetical protein
MPRRRSKNMGSGGACPHHGRKGKAPSGAEGVPPSIAVARRRRGLHRGHWSWAAPFSRRLERGRGIERKMGKAPTSKPPWPGHRRRRCSGTGTGRHPTAIERDRKKRKGDKGKACRAPRWPSPSPEGLRPAPEGRLAAAERQRSNGERDGRNEARVFPGRGRRGSF